MAKEKDKVLTEEAFVKLFPILFNVAFNKAFEPAFDKAFKKSFKPAFTEAFKPAFTKAFEPAFDKAFEKKFEPGFSKAFEPYANAIKQDFNVQEDRTTALENDSSDIIDTLGRIERRQIAETERKDTFSIKLTNHEKRITKLEHKPV